MSFIRENILKIVTVVVILIIVILVCVFMTKGTSSTNSKTYTGLEESLKTAAEKYANNNTKLLPKSEEEQSKITMDTLVKAEYISEMYAIDNENTKCSGYVSIIKKNDTYKYIPYIKCGKYYETKTIADYIKTNSEIVTSNDGLYQVGNKYVYKGEDPDNYLTIGEKTYRIIEISEDNELRLISTTRYDENVVWDDRYNVDKQRYYGINDFSKSRLRDSLDEAYDSEFFTDEERSLIVAHNICIGKKYLNDASIDGTTECQTQYPDQKIGLIYVAEYMRASIDPNCTNSNSESCTNYNYLETISSSLKTITAVADNSYQVYKINYGTADVSNASSTSSIYPVIYIDKLALYNSGDGTIDNPYTVR